jgi:hypothetical protein
MNTTTQQSLLYIFLSIFVIVFARYFYLLFIYLDLLYTFVNLKLAHLFNDNEAGRLLRGAIILTLLPIAITAAPALIYRAIKGGLMPYFYEITWTIWFVIVISKIIT